MTRLFQAAAVLGFVFVSMSAQAQDCPPLTDAKAMNDWRDRVVTMSVNGEHAAVIEKIEACFGSDVTKQPACYRDVYDWSNLKYFNISIDQRVMGASASMPMQSPRDFPKEFWVTDAQGNIDEKALKFPKDIVAAGKKNGWEVLAYRTRSTGGFDGSPNLTIVGIRDNVKKLDTYLQISPPEVAGDNKRDGNVNPDKVRVWDGQATLTIITVDRSKTPPEGHSILLKETDTPNVYEWKKNYQATSCMGCHTNPLRVISPLGTHHLSKLSDGTEEMPMNDANKQKYLAVRSLMNVYGISWAKPTIQVSKDGKTKSVRAPILPDFSEPPYGWAPKDHPTLSDGFLRACGSEIKTNNFQGFGNFGVNLAPSANFPNDIRWDKVRSAMNCVRCHDGSVRGFLHRGLSTRELLFKIRIDQQMPPWDGKFKENMEPDKLTESEQTALYECLIKQQKDPDIKKAWLESGRWLKSVRCTVPQ